MNVEEFINDPAVYAYFSRWDYSIQNRFRDLLIIIGDVCGEFDSSVTQNKNSIRCGLYVKDGASCKNHFFTFKFKQKDFGFEISCQKSLRQLSDSEHPNFRGETDPYIKFPSVSTQHLVNIRNILSAKIENARANFYLPQQRAGLLPSQELNQYGVQNYIEGTVANPSKGQYEIKFSPRNNLDIPHREDDSIEIPIETSIGKYFFTFRHTERNNIWASKCRPCDLDASRQPQHIKLIDLLTSLGFSPRDKITFDFRQDLKSGIILSSNSIQNNTSQTITMKKSIVSPLNQILYGPPGTGKTYHTVEAAVKAAEPSFDTKNRSEWKQEFDALSCQQRIRFVTFHQSYGYEEFVQGLRAETEDGQIHYKVQSGIFKQICEDAAEDPENNYVLVIDEINRGNISKIFGELITLIEDSKRKNVNDEGELSEALSLRLPYSKSEEPDFFVPTNLFIIGTMNTADRSLSAMDTALRRRFHFTEMMPDPSVFVESGVKVEGLDLVKMLTIMNQRIEFLYDREHTLGHAFFMSINNSDDPFAELKGIFKNKIIPLLEEYFFEDWEKIQLVLGDNQKAEKYQFVCEEKSFNAEGLFGKKSSHELNLEPQKQFKLNDGAFDLIDAYKGIYSVLQSDSSTNYSANDASEVA